MQAKQESCDILRVETKDDSEINTEETICSVIREFLNEIITKEGYDNYDTIIKKKNTDGGNYLGNLYEVDIKGQTKSGQKETNIFVKHKPNEQLFQSIVSISQCYSNEIFLYEKIGKIMSELYEEAGVPDNYRLKMVKYYTESTTHALFFENLSRKGYTTLDRRSLLPLNFTESAIKELAKFHALTFILKEKRRDFFDEMLNTIKSPVFFDGSDKPTRDQWEGFLTTTMNLSFDRIDPEFHNKKDEIKRLREKMLDIMSIDSISRLSSVNCMCHGDIKSGNILWRENDKGEADTVFIDYQQMSYGTPIYDILYLIYLGTDRKFRKDHLDNLKNLYHDTMTEFMKYFDLDVNSFYPRNLFEKDFKDKLDYGLLFGLFYLPFILNEEPDVVASGVSDRTVAMHFSLKDRLDGVVRDYIEWGIL